MHPKVVLYTIIVSSQSRITIPGNLNDPTYPRHSEIPKDTPRLAAEDAPSLDLDRPCVRVHSRELELGLCAHARCEGRVANNVSEGLSVVVGGSVS